MDKNTFTELGISQHLCNQLKAHNIHTPNAMQQAVIPPLIKGENAIIEAQTGSGKTLAFTLPLIERHIDGTIIIIVPTRELAIQINEVLSSFIEKSDAAIICGGRNFEFQRQLLQNNLKWLIATPGRLLAHLSQGNITSTTISAVVLDEADQLLEVGFWEEVGQIMTYIPNIKQTILVSATMPDTIMQHAKKWLPEYYYYQQAKSNKPASDIQQIFIQTTTKNKGNELCKLINTHCTGQGIIFCRTHWRADKLGELLTERGYPAAVLHGKMTQHMRESVMKNFRSGMLQLLIATEVASRGLDISTISHVFNYDIPREIEAYIHRIGRSGRYGAKGIAFTLVTPEDKVYVQKLKAALAI